VYNAGKAESEKPADEKPKLYLLEFDRRFEVFPEFVFYDFNSPLNLPRKCGLWGVIDGRVLMRTADMKGSVDHIICDPPFLSEDCQTKGEINSITLILMADL
jgi:hypothetical protein